MEPPRACVFLRAPARHASTRAGERHLARGRGQVHDAQQPEVPRQAEVPLPYAKALEQAALPGADHLLAAIHATLDAVNFRRAGAAVHA